MSLPRDLRVPALDMLPIVDARLYLGLFEERFGIPADTFREYAFFRANVQAIWIVRRDLLLPARPKPYAVGMPFYYYRMIHPRPTTPAVLRWGHLATRHLADLGADQIGPFVDYQDVPQTAEQEAAFSRGYWLMRFRGRLLGVGLATTDDENRPVWRAMTPKFWRLRRDQTTDGPGDPGMEE